jgi:cytosine/adenosine deaminase-related metal-dependent hydrolase
MNNKKTISRRGFLGAMTALGSIGLAACGTQSMRRASVAAADHSAAKLPDRGEFVVRAAQVLTMDTKLGDIAGGDIHVRAGDIVAVGKDLRTAGGETIDGTDMIALPGLIDTHSHLWNTPLRNLVDEGPKMGYFALTLALGKEYTPEDMYRGVRLGVTEMLYSGITTVHDWSHNIRSPAYADSDLRALRDIGIRARLSYGTPQGGLSRDQTMDLADLARVKREWFTGPTDSLLTLGMASRSLSDSPRGAVSIPTLHRDWDGARKLGLPITIHTGGKGRVALLEKESMLGPDVQLINPTGFDEADFGRVVRSKAHVCLSPFAEMRSSFLSSRLLDMLKHGILVSLSIDTAAISGNNDMFAHMHALIDTQFAIYKNPLSLSARQVLELATINGARDLGIADRVGSLTPGKRADLILVRTADLNMAPLGDPVQAIVRSAQPHNVDTVVVDGRILKRGGQMTAVDVQKVVREASESLAALRARAGV